MDGVVVQPHRERPIQAAQVRALYDQADWWPERTDAQIAQVLNAAPAVGAWAGGELVGFARVVSDGVFRAFIEDVVVHEQYRRRGVGTELNTRLLAEIQDIHIVTLFCKQSLQPFYQGQGFQPTKQVVLHLNQLTDEPT
jgi:ribosomal protein S18 acetylase RimI-like enzyme